ncbi:class I SAM-dependent DNA methyltransferase [Brevibacillus laterosporus]|uniref:class I SAM-dependent DNA methyltransferase n=1 Tax=Brevibacillus laterosporus TaxID=1465 RepID=UPI002651E32D|nr:class I SAM-dependent methyltransferase [Brevibacillus laterosporus]MDN9010878.1 class I SAM-dependent methyltransferase [Brevibacillus laterosporus]MDO0941901.1 class I SAM-dependent methyltransferase [Brevibacillus laterosporus]
MSYTHLATVYDALMADTPYQDWLVWAEDYWQLHGKPQTILDLGCGTGSIAIPLAQKGYQVTGVDLSPEMLAIAYEKMKTAHVDINWVEQDMTELSVSPIDSVISFCDCLSYITEKEAVQATFQRVYQHLKPGGTFLFDVHSPYKILTFFGNNTFTHVDEEINYIWQCYTDEERIEVEHDLTFFIRLENGCYQKREETQYQRAYQPTEIILWLREAGFEEIKLTADFVNLPPVAESERLFFSAKRPHD